MSQHQVKQNFYFGESLWFNIHRNQPRFISKNHISQSFLDEDAIFVIFFFTLFMGKHLISVLISVLPESMLKTQTQPVTCAFPHILFPVSDAGHQCGLREIIHTIWSSSLSPPMSSESMSEPRALAGRPGNVARAIENGGAVIHGLLSWMLRLPECLCAG